MHSFRERRARKRGYAATVIAYTGYGGATWVRVLGRVLLTRNPRAGSRAERKQLKRIDRVRGWRSFTSVPVGDVLVTVTIDDISFQVKADRGGVIDEELPVVLKPGWHTVKMHTVDSEVSESEVFVVDPATRLGVLSDVDDTVMVTALPRPLVAAWNTFVLDEHARIPTPGMAVFLERLAASHPGAPVIYLSTGAWNVAPTLTRFLDRNLYPKGALLLTDWGPTHDRLFRSGREHKRTNLVRLAREFPNIKWLLIGDDGQKDEEIYGEFAAQHPEHVAAVAIRQLSPGEAVLAGGRSSPDQHSETADIPWAYSPHGAGLEEQLTAFGVI
ncbi:App1 family protein [Homoserinimonas sp. OAct 916]|uniref:App1 family protein n=1 Tax=Homoserinimonas sp. OAct 916 TaxID=2211450 RepID=UPI000DBE0AA3|nr:phosphatase domain-containing protein [Homoserinimonas sp. OAct 916]